MRSVRRNFARHRSAFTLVEALIASVVVAAATAGVASMLAASSQQSGALQDSTVCQALARQMMEEIAAKPVADSSGAISLGHESGETSRSLYDQVDDYDGYTDTTDQITMVDGTSINLGDGQVYTRSVAVEYRATPSGASTAATTAPFCVVTVTVKSPGGIPTKLVRLFARTSTS